MKPLLEDAAQRALKYVTQVRDMPAVPHADDIERLSELGGELNEATGAPEFFTWQGAEKTYADFQLTVSNPGGHSSAPHADNAINRLAEALIRVHNHRFTPQLSGLTRTYFIEAARYEPAGTAAAMRVLSI